MKKETFFKAKKTIFLDGFNQGPDVITLKIRKGANNIIANLRKISFMNSISFELMTLGSYSRT